MSDRQGDCVGVFLIVKKLREIVMDLRWKRTAT